MDDDFSAAGDLESRADEHSTADSASLAVVRREIKSLNIARTFVYALMITLSTITAEVVFVLVRMKDESDFKNNFKMYGNLLIESFYEKLETKVATAEFLATSLSIQAHDKTESQWPFLSFSEFDSRCDGPRLLAQASSITFAPLVEPVKQKSWEIYAVLAEDQGVLTPHHQVQSGNETPVFYHNSTRSIQDGMYAIHEGHAYDVGDEESFFFPVWQRSPYPSSSNVRMYDQMSNYVRAQALAAMVQRQAAVMSDFMVHDTNMTDFAFYSTPRVTLYSPIFHTVDRDEVVGSIDFEFQWEAFLEDVIDNGTETIVVVIENSCGKNYSFEVLGSRVSYLGEGGVQIEAEDFDPPEPVVSSYSDFGKTMARLSKQGINFWNDTLSCDYRIRVLATPELLESHMTNDPTIFRFVVLAIFLVTIGVFLVYDCVVERRSNRVVESAKRTDALVSTLFPSDVKKRLLEQEDRKQKEKSGARKNNLIGWQVDSKALSVSDDSEMHTGLISTPKHRLKSFLGGGMDAYMGGEESEPIADLFPNASVMFADIAGFTAWSSERDPSQVFQLLETLYRAMDKAARRFSVFKVETIGDCYVAAAGLPVQREDHVEILVRFARMCLLRSNELTKALESSLGPGTAELALRFGIHSGPVTAGVLRGEKARFQLFGDTMNFAARMESTGTKNKIHLSQASADLLAKRGKPHWVRKREDKVYAKGKGELQTYWLEMGSSSCSASGMSASTESSCASSELSDYADHHTNSEEKTVSRNVLHEVIGKGKVNKSIDRLVDWNTGALSALLTKVVACRREDAAPAQGNLETPEEKGDIRSFLNEVEMVISLPGYDHETATKMHLEGAQLRRVVKNELRSYISSIASGYRKNSFHNFEHASHVILSATKLLKRISYADGHQNEDLGVTTEDLHAHTYGISSDTLTQFAVVFAALIHDVGHEGIPNGQLAKELPHIAARYDHKSIAEQRSVDVALELLALSKYENLRNCICGTEKELKRFRKLLINCVLATDIFDPDLKKARNLRWDQAFHADSKSSEFTTEDMNRKATIVIEHIIQASDVSHTMQHWHIYLKWNERLFQEMYTAYKSGRADKDPSVGWYKGELWFFDNYVIPLAKKLEECGVFGVSSDEYLTYATQNRQEWADRGEEVCRAMLEKCERSLGRKGKKIDVVPEEDENVSERGAEDMMKDDSQTGFKDH